MPSSRRTRFIAIVLLLAVIILFTGLWVNEGPLWRLVMLKQVPFESVQVGMWGESTEYQVRGWETIWRWKKNRHGSLVAYYVENGFKAIEEVYENGEVRITRWRNDGRLMDQEMRNFEKSDEDDTTGPWLWGKSDQTKPTAPWWDHETNAPKD